VLALNAPPGAKKDFNMTSPDLASMTLKDLRQLASEHSLPNRSRLAKQDLISALNQLIVTKDDSTPSPETKTPTNEPSADTVTDNAETAPATNDTGSPAETFEQAEQNQEQEAAPTEEIVLGPDTVAALTNGGTSAGTNAENSNEASKDQPETQTNSANDDEGTRSDESAATDENGDENDESTGRKKRRRRRRRGGRGRKNHDHDQENDSPANDDTESATADADAAAESTTTTAESSSDNDAATETPDSESDKDASNQQGGRKGRDRKSDSGQEKHRKPRRPRLNGPVRKVPSVLERLRTFTGGILELCDPETPRWAQARLSELLAEAGLVETPCEGEPHEDFHEIVGTLESKLPSGHIAAIMQPGFCLRGDRGDLFALRKAHVRVSANTEGSDSEEEGHENENDIEGGSAVTETAKDTPQVTDAEKDTQQDSATEQTDTEAIVDGEESVTSGSNESGERNETAEETREDKPRRRRSSRRRDDDSDSDGTAKLKHEPKQEKAENTDEQPEEVATKPRRIRNPLPVTLAEIAEDAPVAEAFSELGLSRNLSATLAAMGFESPSPIQAQGIPVALASKDMIGQAQTGTGKTAAFMLPSISRLSTMETIDGEPSPAPSVMVLCPTRELARQVDAETQKMSAGSSLRTALLYGGVPLDGQIRELERGVHVIIGTPGRVIDLIKRGHLDLSKVQIAVLDEADQMLDIGFLPDVEWLLKRCPEGRQTLLFSATMPPEIKTLTERFQRDPEHVHVAPQQVTAASVDQKYIAVDQDKKTKLLAHFIETFEPTQLVVFCKTKAQTDRVARVLSKKNLQAGAIHGDLPQKKREKTLNDFRAGTLPCLIATNVAARGLDIPSVSHVVNFDVPENPEEYVHRIGRTGRLGGTQGVARTFVTPEDGQFFTEIEKHIGLLLEEEVVEGITASTASAPKERTIAATTQKKGIKIIKPLSGGFRLGRGRRK
jgi:ATP-dependent RNA helicase DeaD